MRRDDLAIRRGRAWEAIDRTHLVSAIHGIEARTKVARLAHEAGLVLGLAATHIGHLHAGHRDAVAEVLEAGAGELRRKRLRTLHHVIEELVLVLPVHVHVHVLRELEADIHVVLRLAQRLMERLADEVGVARGIAMPGVRPLHAIDLIGMRCGQDDVRQLPRGRHEDVDVHEEVQVLESLDDLLAAFDGQDRLARLLPVAVDLERLALGHGLGGHGAEAALLAVDDLAAGVLRDLAQLSGSVISLQDGLIARVLADGELLDVHSGLLAQRAHAAFLVRHHVEHERVVARGRFAPDVLPTLRIEVARERHHDGEGLADARGIDGELHLLPTREACMRASIDVGLDGLRDALLI